MFVRAPSAGDRRSQSLQRSGSRHMGGWKVGPGVHLEVFPVGEDYREHARPGDYTRSVILGSPSSPS